MPVVHLFGARIGKVIRVETPSKDIVRTVVICLAIVGVGFWLNHTWSQSPTPAAAVQPVAAPPLVVPQPPVRAPEPGVYRIYIDLQQMPVIEPPKTAPAPEHRAIPEKPKREPDDDRPRERPRPRPKERDETERRDT